MSSLSRGSLLRVDTFGMCGMLGRIRNPLFDDTLLLLLAVRASGYWEWCRCFLSFVSFSKQVLSVIKIQLGKNYVSIVAYLNLRLVDWNSGIRWSKTTIRFL